MDCREDIQLKEDIVISPYSLNQLVLTTFYTTPAFGLLAFILGGFKFDPKGFGTSSFGGFLGWAASWWFFFYGHSEPIGIVAIVLNASAGFALSTMVYAMFNRGQIDPIWNAFKRYRGR